MALALEKLGRQDDAIVALETVVARDNTHDQAYFFLAQAYWREGSLAEALVNVDRVLELQPISSGAHYLKGRVLLSKGETDKAVEEFKVAIGYDPDYAPGYIGLGLAFAEMGREEEAVNNFTRAAAIDPNLDEANDALREVSKSAK